MSEPPAMAVRGTAGSRPTPDERLGRDAQRRGWPHRVTLGDGTHLEGELGAAQPPEAGIRFRPERIRLPPTRVLGRRRWRPEVRRRLYRWSRSVFQSSAAAQRRGEWGAHHARREAVVRARWARFVDREAQAVRRHLAGSGPLDRNLLVGFLEDVEVLRVLGDDHDRVAAIGRALADRVERTGRRLMAHPVPPPNAVRNLRSLIELAQAFGSDVTAEVAAFATEPQPS